MTQDQPTWSNRTASAWLATVLVLMVLAFYELAHAFAHGWIHQANLLNVRVLFGSIAAASIWSIVLLPLVAIAAFKPSHAWDRTAFRWGGIGTLGGLAVGWFTDLFAPFVTHFVTFLVDDFVGAMIAIGCVWVLSAATFFKKAERWAPAIAGFGLGVAAAFFSRELPAYAPFFVVEGTLLALVPIVAVIARRVLVPMRIAVFGLGVTAIFGGIGFVTWDLEHPAHTTLTDEVIGFGAFKLYSELGAFETESRTRCLDETPIVVTPPRELKRSVLFVTIDALRDDHATADHLASLYREGFVKIEPSFSVGTRTSDGLKTLMHGRYLDSAPTEPIADILRGAGYDVWASAAVPSPWNHTQVGFPENLGLSYHNVIRESVDDTIRDTAIERLEASNDPFFAWVHFIEPHEPHKPDYESEVRATDPRVRDVIDAAMKKDKDVIIIVTGDHGEALGEFGVQTHVFGAWQSIIRVPLFVRGLPASDGVVSHVDVVPTVLTSLGFSVTGFHGCDWASPGCGDVRRVQADHNGNPYLRGLVWREETFVYDVWRKSYRLTNHDDESHNLMDTDRYDPKMRLLLWRCQ